MHKLIKKALVLFLTAATILSVPVYAQTDSTWYPETTEETLNGLTISKVKLADNSRYKTARIVANEYVAQKGETPTKVILASGENFPDALTANSLAGVYDCPVIISNLNTLSEQTKELLVKDWNKSVKTVYVVGAAFSQSVFDTLKKECGVTTVDSTTYAGTDRFNTAERVCQTVIDEGYTDACMIATGIKAADALSASVWACRLKIPILLAKRDGSISESTKKLADQFKTVYILGADPVVSAATELSFDDKTVRLAGNDRYETSVNISAYFLEKCDLKRESNCIVFAKGADENYPDALVSGSLAACDDVDAPVVLVRSSGLTSDLVTILKNYMSKANWKGYFTGAAAYDNIPETVTGQFA